MFQPNPTPSNHSALGQSENSEPIVQDKAEEFTSDTQLPCDFSVDAVGAVDSVLDAKSLHLPTEETADSVVHISHVQSFCDKSPQLDKDYPLRQVLYRPKLPKICVDDMEIWTLLKIRVSVPGELLYVQVANHALVDIDTRRDWYVREIFIYKTDIDILIGVILGIAHFLPYRALSTGGNSYSGVIFSFHVIEITIFLVALRLSGNYILKALWKAFRQNLRGNSKTLKSSAHQGGGSSTSASSISTQQTQSGISPTPNSRLSLLGSAIQAQLPLENHRSSNSMAMVASNVGDPNLCPSSVIRNLEVVDICVPVPQQAYYEIEDIQFTHLNDQGLLEKLGDCYYKTRPRQWFIMDLVRRILCALKYVEINEV